MKIRYLAGIFLVSSATLCLEISLTRYFSVSQGYHFAFLVISIAFLGYGASGSFLSVFKKITNLKLNKFLSLCSLSYSLTIFFCFLACNSISFDFREIAWNNNQILLIFLYYFLLSLPFFFAGTIISFAITNLPQKVNRIYFSDLMGAGTGTLLAIFIFLPQGDKGVILIISFLVLIAAFLFSPSPSFLFRVLTVILMMAVIGLFIYSPSWLSFRISSYKALPLALRYPQAKKILTEWNAISRVDVIDSPAVRYAPGLSLLYHKKLPPQLGLSEDGGKLTAVTHFQKKDETSLDFLSFLPSSLAYSMVENPRTLLLDPKGGLDVLEALVYRASFIKAVESNPLTIKILQDELNSFSGEIYHHHKIQVMASRPRSVLKKETKFYDLVVFPQTEVFGATGTGLYGFGENYLYTIESFISVLKRLSYEGLVSMGLYLLPPPRQELRALATWIEALEKIGKNPSSHLIALRSWGTIHYFIKKTPFKEKEIQKLRHSSQKYFFDLVYYPGIKESEANIYNQFEKPLYYNLTQKLLHPQKRKKLYRNYLFQIKPVTDNRPFFYNFFKLNKLKSSYKALNQKILPFVQGNFLVYLLLFQSLLIAFVLILLPLFVLKKRKTIKSQSFLPVFLYFSLIGMSFMFVELTLIQKFILFLGHPLYSTSIIIFSLLLSSGLGSFFSKKILSHNIKKNLRRFLFGCGFLIGVYLLVLPVFTDSFIHLSLFLKILLTLGIIFPLGFLMGFPFPNAIRRLERTEQRLIPWAWATNAFSSVISSVAALGLAFWGGYNLVLLLAAGGYLLAILFLGFSYHRYKPDPGNMPDSGLTVSLGDKS